MIRKIEIQAAGLTTLLLLFSLVQCKSSYDKRFEYTCEDGEIFTVLMSQDYESVILNFRGKNYTLQHAMSGSGARFTDGNVVYWSKGETAMIMMDDKIVVQNCILKPEKVRVTRD